MQRPDTQTGPDHSRLRLLGLSNVAAGLWLIVLPFVFHLPRHYPHQLAFWATLATGVLVLSLAILHMLQWSILRGASRGNVALGLWLVASPAIIGYTKYLPNGAAVALASVLTGFAVLRRSGSVPGGFGEPQRYRSSCGRGQATADSGALAQAHPGTAPTGVHPDRSGQTQRRPPPGASCPSPGRRWCR